MEYLRHRAFEHLLREAEEEFGFEQEGVLTIPCETAVFEKVLRVLEQKESGSKMMKVLGFDEDGSGDGKREKNCFCGSEAEVALFGVSRHHPNHKSLCR
ncbi:hypothetical protein AMTR_s00025p00191690 [Amborella trichopoda]|uniref:Auxin-responsive protein n=2 Tax=Amborella trichopoda TaxID=13333 RepID=W1PXD8_AMBTC|nr:hypothetical protein AMTR_s00025p00191690 [Amborella trichopoda]